MQSPCDVLADTSDKIELWFEYLGGGLSSLTRVSPIAKPTTLAVCTPDQLLQAIRYIHSHNVAHRDIKPENVMMTRSLELSVKLIDFGIACKGCEQRDTYPGSFAYIPPSVYRKKDAGEVITIEDMKRHDVFAAGYVLLMLLTRGYWPVRSVFSWMRRRCIAIWLPAPLTTFLASIATQLVAENLVDASDARDELARRDSVDLPEEIATPTSLVRPTNAVSKFKRPRGPRRRR